jgi:hypothetical protein
LINPANQRRLFARGFVDANEALAVIFERAGFVPAIHVFLGARTWMAGIGERKRRLPLDGYAGLDDLSNIARIRLAAFPARLSG